MEPKSFLKTLALIHASLCLTLVAFAIWAYTQNGSFSASGNNNDAFIYIVPVIAMAGYFGGKFFFQKSIQNIRVTQMLSKKLQRYQAAILVKYAFIEGPAFLALFAFWVSGNAMHLAIALSLIVYLFFQRPTKEKLINELTLNLEEKKEFDTLNR